FFFSSRRRHTRCLSDWSSDVCSSDLTVRRIVFATLAPSSPSPQRRRQPLTPRLVALNGAIVDEALRDRADPSSSQEPSQKQPERSEERRVGKECRDRGGRYR